MVAAAQREDTVPIPAGADVALFIDWENFKYSLYEVGQVPDVPALLEAVRERYGRPGLARAYADWQDYYHRKSYDQMNLYGVGIEPVYVPSRRSPTQQDRIKNSVDVRMSLDCLEVSFTHPHLQTFVLVAGDADFLHVVGALRRRGFRVIMIGVSGCTSQRLGAVVDDLLFYDLDIGRSQPAALPPEGGTPPTAPPSLPPPPPFPVPVGSSADSAESKAREVEDAAQTLVRLVRQQRDQEGGRNYPPLVSWLQLQMRDNSPFFVPQKYGFARLKDFAILLERQGLVRVQTVDLTDRVWLAEDAAEMERETGRVPAPDTEWAKDEQLAQQRAEFADVVLTADDIENSHREYMGRGLLAKFLYNKGHWDPADLPARAAPIQSSAWREMDMPEIHRLLDAAVDRGILIQTTYADSYSGFDVAAMKLDRTHPFVRHALSSAAF